MAGHLFVYGTLRRDAGHAEHATLAGLATFEAPARVRGRLYIVDWYPGLVVDADAGWVVGELWRLHPGADLTALDVYEGCGPDDPAPHEYARTIVGAERTDTAAAVDTWIYAYAGSTDRLAVVATGDWLKR